MRQHDKYLQAPECQHSHAKKEGGEEAEMSPHYWFALDSQVRDLGAEHVIGVYDFVEAEFCTHIK